MVTGHHHDRTRGARSSRRTTDADTDTAADTDMAAATDAAVNMDTDADADAVAAVAASAAASASVSASVCAHTRASLTSEACSSSSLLPFFRKVAFLYFGVTVISYQENQKKTETKKTPKKLKKKGVETANKTHFRSTVTSQFGSK